MFNVSEHDTERHVLDSVSFHQKGIILFLHRKMNQLESCETNLSFKNILDVVNKAFFRFRPRQKIYIILDIQQKRNAYQLMEHIFSFMLH